MKKAGILLLFFSLIYPLPVFYARTADPDTLISIRDVKVYAQRSLYYQEDKKVISCDSMLVLPSVQESLGDLLQRMAPVSLMQYGGAGSLSTLSLRGSSSEQTQVNWNGFPLNSLTSGIADLSQINAGMFEEILLIPGASGSLYGSGTFGGAVNLDNHPDRRNKITASAGLNTGSFGTTGENFMLRAGTQHFQSKSGFFYQHVKNNFPYPDEYKPGTPTEISIHNRFKQAAFMQTFSGWFSHGVSLQTGFWYQKEKKEIPAVMGSYQPNYQEQRDSSFRVYLILNKRGHRSSLSVRGAWFQDNMWFTDKTSAHASDYILDSRFRSRHFMTDLYTRYHAGRHWSLDGGIASSLTTVTVTAYNGTRHEYSLDLYAGTKYRNKRWTGSLTLRQNFNPYKNPLPQADVGFRYALQPGKKFLRFNLSSKYRLPTLNDKYWSPGGNPDLKPEQGWGVTGGIDLQSGHTGDTQNSWSFRWQTDLFSNILNDQIRWIPGEGYWHPENIEKVWAYGAENSLQSSWHKKYLVISGQLNYNFTLSSVLEDRGKEAGHYQSSYIPVHTASGMLRLGYRFFYTGIYEHVTGTRYTTPDNDPLYKLNPYALTDVILGGKKNKRSFTLDLRFVIRNLFNTHYQVIRSYPMPGRAYYLKLQFTFKANHSIHSFTHSKIPKS